MARQKGIEEWVEAVRAEFPTLSRAVNGRSLAYLDNAASTMKPRRVIDAMQRFYAEDYSNVNRGTHYLSQVATRRFESARESVRRFIGAGESREVIFTGGTTAAINLVAYSWGEAFLGRDDEVLISTMEHHSNIVPWQMLCERKNARLRVAALDEDGALDMAALAERITPRTKMVAVTHVSNVLGVVNPVKEIVRLAHEAGAHVLIDGAQAIPHMPVNVQELDADFYAFSSHKMFGPTGIGVLYGKSSILTQMPPWQGGGDMIGRVSFDGSTWANLPHKFEAGTPNIAGAIGLAEAIDYLEGMDRQRMADWEFRLAEYAIELLGEIEGVRILGPQQNNAGAVSFVLEGVHAHDIGAILDKQGLATRTGHHCAQPLLKHFGIESASRASFAFYNTMEEVERLAEGVRRVVDLFCSPSIFEEITELTNLD